MIKRRQWPLELEQFYREKGYWGISLDQAFSETVERSPEREAIRDSRGSVTFSELADASLRLARAFHELGIRSEDRVVVQLPDGRDFAAIHLALMRLRAVTVPVVPTYRAREVRSILTSSRAVGVITPGLFRGFDYGAMIEELRGDLPFLRWAVTTAESGNGPDLPLNQLLSSDPFAPDDYPSDKPQDDDILVLLSTAGSTGPSKGILRTHNSFLCHADTLARNLGYSSATTIANFCPLTHAAGLAVLYITLLKGASLAVMDRFEAARALDLIEAVKADVVASVPTQTIALLEGAKQRPASFHAVQKIHSGGGACPEAVKRQVLFDLEITFIDLYGMTEGVSATARPEDPPEKVIQTAGRPGRPEEEIRVLGEAGEGLPTGQVGEIVSLSPILFSGYFEDPASALEAHTADGWFRTGDLGFFDEEGYLHVVGRKKEVISRGSETFNPKEVEELLMKHPRIREVAVVGIPDERYGERACAFVETIDDDPFTLQEAARHLKTVGLASFKIPERVEKVQAGFPRTADGKIHKLELRKHLLQRIEQESDPLPQ
jgi:non-ribosomal peptide synthetase component E (peptide arylation enzyme)